jgi:hypothetical protein
MSAHELKQLQVRKAKLEAEVATLLLAKQEAEKAYTDAKDKVKALTLQIKAFCTEPTVSEHAMLRYLERAKGINLEALQAEILTPTNKAKIKFMGSGKLAVGDLQAVVKDMVVVSVTN